MAAASIKRRFRITGVNSTPSSPAGPGAAVAGVTVSAVLVNDNPAIGSPPGGFQWPFDDPDGSVAGFFVVNQVVELSFSVPPAGA